MRTYGHWVWLAFGALVTAGCAGGQADGLPREPISGKVTLDGEPLATGSITFVPTGFDGPPAGSEIKDGAYSISRQDGPIPGLYSVRVYSSKATGKQLSDPGDPGAIIEEMFEVIPPQYNVKSELKATVTQGGANNFDFGLTGAIKTPPKPSKR